MYLSLALERGGIYSGLREFYSISQEITQHWASYSMTESTLEVNQKAFTPAWKGQWELTALEQFNKEEGAAIFTMHFLWKECSKTKYLALGCHTAGVP